MMWDRTLILETEELIREFFLKIKYDEIHLFGIQIRLDKYLDQIHKNTIILGYLREEIVVDVPDVSRHQLHRLLVSGQEPGVRGEVHGRQLLGEVGLARRVVVEVQGDGEPGGVLNRV